MVAKSERGILLNQICALPNLTAAWRAVRGNIAAARRASSCGVDEVSVAAFEQQWEKNLTELSASMLDGRYEPLPPRRIELRKRSGETRAIGLLAVRDRVAQRAAYQVVEPLFEEEFLDCSYGFRPGRSVDDAIHRVLCYRQAGCAWAFDADIAACFDSLDHRLLMRFVAQTVHERPVLRLIEGWLHAGVLEADAEVYRIPGAWERLLDGIASRLRPTYSGPEYRWDSGAGESADDLILDENWQRRELLKHVGTDALLAGLTLIKPGLQKALPAARRLAKRKAVVWGAAGVTGAAALAGTWLLLRQLSPRPCGALQGGSLSPLLANVYLHQFDRAMIDAGQNLVRFADDFVICCPDRDAAEQAGGLAAQELASLRMRLNPSKTGIVSFNKGFRFLGHRFRE